MEKMQSSLAQSGVLSHFGHTPLSQPNHATTLRSACRSPNYSSFSRVGGTFPKSSRGEGSRHSPLHATCVSAPPRSSRGGRKETGRDNGLAGSQSADLERGAISRNGSASTSGRPPLAESANGRRTGGVQGTPRQSRMSDMKSQVRRVRQQMEEDEDLATLMRGLRGQNLSDELFAAEDVKMRLVEVKEGDTSTLPQVYDPELIAAYWSRRPLSVVTRIFQLLSVAGGFLSGIAFDIAYKKVKENEVKRAIELREIVTSLGPAYIKLGQALSIRPDILSPAAMAELQKLCDKVPSFPNDVAMQLIEDELGRPWQEIYSELSPSPIAAASLGQVYRGRLGSTGEAVAVKVQRPYVLETVTIDLFIIRRLGLALRKIPQIATDVVGLVDEWAARFFEELDYVNEGQNAIKFAEMMRVDLPQVVVPVTFPEYTSRRVLTQSWIEGEKLSQSVEDDVGALVGIGVICYLKQLLDTGFFHADPHPGNLVRTPDGRLAILDFGLMTQITDDQKYGMMEAISHLIHRDYKAIVEDFVLLDFIPEGVDLTPIMPVLARVFDQALEGGGAKSINFQELAADLAQITFDYPFRIPPYFALIIRAIGVLEGIALVGNPDFAIVDEAYPYIAQRLLTDDSPRLRATLRYTVYGKSNVFDAERFIDVLEAFETFATAARSGSHPVQAGSMASLGRITPLRDGPLAVMSPLLLGGASTEDSSGSGNQQQQQQQQQSQTRVALAFLLSAEGVFFRDFILDEVVKGIDALSREQWTELVTALNLNRLPGMIPPYFLPGAVRPLSIVPRVTDEDRAVLANVRTILAFLSGRNPQFAGHREAGDDVVGVVTAARELLPVLPSVASEVMPQIATRLASRVVARTLRDLYLD